MDKSYSVSNIAGYSDHLPVKHVRLPLKYPLSTQSQSLNDEFYNKVSDAGNIINISKQIEGSLFIEYVSYNVLNDFKTIDLTPILLQQNTLDLKFQRLQILLPHSIQSSSRLTIQLFKEDDNQEPSLLLDFVDENFLFISLKFELTDFIFSEDKFKSRLSLDNFHFWGHISVPYSFELRTSPFLVRASDSRNIFISMKDGGLLHFKRSRPLEPFDVYNFNDSTSILPLNFFNGFLQKSKNRETISNGISSNSVVDLVPIDDHLIVTLSVTKILKVWNLQTHNQVSTPINLDEGLSNSDSSVWLNSVPTKYLQLFEEKSTNKRYLTTHYTATSTINDGQNNQRLQDESGYYFKTWEIVQDISHTQTQLIQQDRLTFKPEIPDLLTIENQSEQRKMYSPIWLIQDYQTQVFDRHIKFHILWKSNTASIVVTYTLNFDNGSILFINWSHSNNIHITNELSPQHSIEYYQNKILNSGLYDKLSVETALNIFREHAKLDVIRNFDKVSIRQSIVDTIKTSTFSDTRNSWYKLDLLCEEFKKLGQEALALTLTNKSSIITLQVNGIGVFRPSHYYESFTHQKISTSEGKVLNLLNGLSNKLSNKTYNKLYHNVSTLSRIDEAKASELYNTFFLNKVSDEEAQQIMHDLETIPNAIDVINSLIDPIYDDHDLSSNESVSDLGLLSKFVTINTFKNIKSHHESILLNLLVLFLICEVNDLILLLINKIIKKLSTYSIIDLIFSTSFTSNSDIGKVENFKLNDLQFSLFWPAIVDKNPQLISLLKSGKLNESYDFFHSNVISTIHNDFIVDVVTELINHGEGSLISDKFFSKLNNARPIDELLIGLVHLINNEPSEFFRIFQNYEVFQKNNKPSIKEKLLTSLTSNHNINSFLESIFISEKNLVLLKTNYYHSLSELSKSQSDYSNRHYSHLQKFITPNLTTTTTKKSMNSDNEIKFIESALDFEKTAIEAIKQNNEISNDKLEEYYLNIFEMSLNLSNYELVYESLYNLKSLTARKLYKSLFFKFIKNLLSNQTISIIFPPNSNQLYKDEFLLIDSIILELANSELTLSNSLKCYEYLYSWRLFGCSNDMTSKNIADKRGAIESLYLFVTRFKIEQSNLLSLGNDEDIKQYNLKILEVYIVIINCLKSFDDDEDKWVISHHKNGETLITKIDQIIIEYYEWLKLLERDLN